MMIQLNDCTPNEAEAWLLRAAVGRGDVAAQAWREWCTRIDLDDISPASYQLLPLVYHNLAGVEAADFGRLKGVYRHTWGKNQTVLYELEQLVRQLNVDGIAPLLLRGTAMVTRYYDETGLRPLHVLDLAISAENCHLALAAIAQHGWQSHSDAQAINVFQKAGLTLNLHSPARVVGADWLSATWREHDVQYLSATDELIQICLWGVRWSPSYLNWIPDALTILDNAEIVWETLLARAKATRNGVALRHTLGYLREVFSAEIPPHVLTTLNQMPASWLEKQMYLANGRATATLLTNAVHRIHQFREAKKPSPPEEESIVKKTAMEEIFLWSLRPNLSPEALTVLNATPPAEWQHNAKLAIQRKIVHYWVNRLKQYQLFDHLPPELQANLEREYNKNKWRNLHIYKLLNELLGVLDGLDVMLLKGAHLANYVYAERGMRQMIDVDILVRVEQLDEAVAAIETLGYTIADGMRDWSLEHHYHWLLEPPAGQELRVELHWHVKRPNHSAPFPVDLIWAESEQVQLSRYKAHVMSAELLLVYFVWHAMHHEWEDGLKTAVDMLAVLQRHTIDWGKVAQLANQLQIAKQVALLLHLIVISFEGDVPEKAIKSLYPEPFDAAVSHTAAQHLFFRSGVSAEFASLWTDGKPNLGVLWRSFVPPKRELGYIYTVSPKSWRIYPQYPRHAVNLIRQHWRTGWRVLRGDAAAETEISLVNDLLGTSEWLELSDEVRMPAHRTIDGNV